LFAGTLKFRFLLPLASAAAAAAAICVQRQQVQLEIQNIEENSTELNVENVKERFGIKSATLCAALKGLKDLKQKVRKSRNRATFISRLAAIGMPHATRGRGNWGQGISIMNSQAAVGVRLVRKKQTNKQIINYLVCVYLELTLLI